MITSALLGLSIATVLYGLGACLRRWDRKMVPPERLAALDARLQHPDAVQRLFRERKDAAAYRLYQQETGASLREARVAMSRVGWRR